MDIVSYNNNFSPPDSCEQIQPIEFHQPQVHKKGWGEEVWIANTKKYCGKILKFDKGTKFSVHFHGEKEETFFLLYGSIRFNYYNLKNADKMNKTLVEGDVVYIPRGNPHQIEALEDSAIIEFSSPHFEEDSYRIEKGDSQKTNEKK